MRTLNRLCIALLLSIALGGLAQAGNLGDSGGFSGGSASPPGGSSGGVSSVTGSGGVASSGGSTPNITVPGWPLTTWQDFVGPTTSNFAFSANGTGSIGVYWPAPVTFSHICINIQTGDGSGLYDWGFYSHDGSTLIADVGPQHVGTGWICSSTVQGTVTAGPGNLVFAYTGNSTTAHFSYIASGTHWIASGGACTTSGGQLCSSITTPVVGVSGGGPLVDKVY